ncbi:hypothetical protein CDC45_18065 (plasmid) [Ralstonia pseudosolanacearum]|uniref:Uncharacterized protein n=1 Tax=Ralstonia nicotianae (strain ATCC BAA-1114 / GMI1000) TaxID=267608 RepID=Q8XTL0_RALN1|nr:hypothetical protein CDC45_18065 [Ralstonia pseudosolanacearum]CAD17249.1 hypothetical protein RSp0098 [Ralstonia pseudosolanacearum GMI1000]
MAESAVGLVGPSVRSLIPLAVEFRGGRRSAQHLGSCRPVARPSRFAYAHILSHDGARAASAGASIDVSPLVWRRHRSFHRRGFHWHARDKGGGGRASLFKVAP